MPKRPTTRVATDRPRCLDCDRPARWVRCTQFAGDHPFCEEHARLEPDFGKDDPSYFYWFEVKDA